MQREECTSVIPASVATYNHQYIKSVRMLTRTQAVTTLITGELKSKIDSIWDSMWSGGISNPLSVIEQLTYLLFIMFDALAEVEPRVAAG